MITVNDKVVDALNTILDKTDYIFVIKSLRGFLEFFDPWSDFERMRDLIDRNVDQNKPLIKLFCLGIPMTKQEWDACELKDEINTLIEANILKCDDTHLSTNNYCIVVYQGLRLLTELNPWYETCKNKDTDIYIGLDSLRLAENIKFNKQDIVLDLCSGTGIQGILAARSAKKVISVELNPKAAKVIELNAKLNGLNNIIEIREGDLYSVLSDDEVFSAVYVNPPFIPITKDVIYPICGAGGEDGIDVLKRIVSELDNHLAPLGEAFIFCQCLGNNENIFFDQYIDSYSRQNAWSLTSLILDKVPAEYQIDMLGKLTKLFNNELNLQEFKKEMLRVYKRLNASYFYTIIYKVRKNNHYTSSRIELFNKWGLEDRALTQKDISFTQNTNSFEVNKNSIRVGFVDGEAKKLYELLEQKYSVEEAVTNFVSRKGSSDFVCKTLQMCGEMEALGIIHRKITESP